MQRKRSASLTSLRVLVTLIAVGVIAVFIYGASQSAPSAHAAWSTCQIGQQTKEFGQVKGKDGTSHDVLLRSLSDGSNSMAWTYSAQIGATTTAGTGGYNEASWRDAPISNLPKIQGVLMAGAPQLTAGELGAKAGVPTLTDAQAGLATQAAIWHFSDGFQLDLNDPTGSGSSDAAVAVAYQWLVNSVSEQSEPAEFLSLPTSGAGIEGEKVGPITFSSKDSAPMALVVTPAQTMVYTDGQPVDLKAVQSGRPMYLLPSTKAGDAVLAATTSSGFALSPGRLFVSAGHQTQIVAKAQAMFKQVSVTVSWQLAQQPSGGNNGPSASTPAGQGIAPSQESQQPSTAPTSAGSGVAGSTSHATDSATSSSSTTAPSSTSANSTSTSPSASSTSVPSSSSSSSSTASTASTPASSTASTGGAVATTSGAGSAEGNVSPSTQGAASDSSGAGDGTPSPSVTAQIVGHPAPPPMAQTGANLVGGLMTAMAFLVAGGLFLAARKKSRFDLR